MSDEANVREANTVARIPVAAGTAELAVGTSSREEFLSTQHSTLAPIRGALPLGVTGNTPDSGSGESWFEPRRGNSGGGRKAAALSLPRLGHRLLRLRFLAAAAIAGAVHSGIVRRMNASNMGTVNAVSPCAGL